MIDTDYDIKYITPNNDINDNTIKIYLSDGRKMKDIFKSVIFDNVKRFVRIEIVIFRGLYSDDPVNIVLPKILKKFKNLICLSIESRSKKYNLTGLGYICKLKKLSYLKLTGFSKIHIPWNIKKLLRLRTLDLTENDIINHRLKSLQEFKQHVNIKFFINNSRRNQNYIRSYIDLNEIEYSLDSSSQVQSFISNDSDSDDDYLSISEIISFNYLPFSRTESETIYDDFSTEEDSVLHSMLVSYVSSYSDES